MSTPKRYEFRLVTERRLAEPESRVYRQARPVAPKDAERLARYWASDAAPRFVSGWIEVRKIQYWENYVIDDDQPPGKAEDRMNSSAIELIAAERNRQLGDYPYDHDDEHAVGELAMAAATYAWPTGILPVDSGDLVTVDALWPWNRRSLHRTLGNREGELVKAGALIVAEIERLHRREARSQASSGVVLLFRSDLPGSLPAGSGNRVAEADTVIRVRRDGMGAVIIKNRIGTEREMSQDELDFFISHMAARIVWLDEVK